MKKITHFSTGLLILTLLPIAMSAQGQNLVTEKAIHAAVEEFVRAELKDQLAETERCEIHTRWQGNVEVVEGGATEIALRRVSTRPFRGPTMARAEIKVDGETIRALTVTVDTRVFAPVLVTSRGVRRGESISEDAVQIRERDVTSEDGYYSNFGQLEGMQFKRSVGLDRVITRTHVEFVPVVNRGDEVSLIVQTDNLQVTTLGVALQDGGVGERIRVKNQDSGKMLQGEILATGIVRIDL